MLLRPIFLASVLAASATAGVLDHSALLQRETWWDNRDWAWYEKNIPFFDCPNRDMVTTYYYRWELITKHVVEGSNEHGYAFTEFMDRPFWSGTYGSISCPSGHQLYEVRWLRDSAYAQDYARYWHRVPGAQPRRYSAWLADATWAVHAVQEAPQLMADLFEPLKANYQGWAERQYVPEKGMFWQNGHDDGMEFNINSRQTQDILRGANAFRPTFNAYMWADAMAISRTAEMLHKPAEATAWAEKAAKLKETLQTSLWDEKRHFFFPRSWKEEVSKSGQKVHEDTLTYESGEFAGSDQGRELIGYVPWQFTLPDAGKGYEAAWQYLMAPDYFGSAFGPTTVGQKDPMFHLEKGCCWWSGRSWPFATAQTLKALANLLQNYDQKVVNAADYLELLRIFAQTHRKNGKPYIAEAADPFTGSWEGHDAYNHSEHYFHSSYCDLVLTGLVGLNVDTPGKLGLHPLFPETWDFCAVDNLKIRNREVAVFWDRTGSKYGKGKGLHVLADGREIYTQENLRPVRVDLAPRELVAESRVPQLNLALNNGGSRFPEMDASAEGEKSSAAATQDGQYWYSIHPPNRWTSQGSEGKESSLEVDLGTSREFQTAELFLIDDQNEPEKDRQGSTVALPLSIRWQEWHGDAWKDLAQDKSPTLRSDAAHRFEFQPTQSRRLKALFTPQPGKSVGVSEFRVLGPKTAENLAPVPIPPAGNNLARSAQVTASHTSQWDTPKEANDGIVQFKVEPRNRWTCFASKEAQDWLAFSWDQAQELSRLELYIFDDRGQVQAPASFTLETWQEAEQKWLPVPTEGMQRQPQQPKGGKRNTVQFPIIQTKKLRILWQHRKGVFSGVTEVEIF